MRMKDEFLRRDFVHFVRFILLPFLSQLQISCLFLTLSEDSFEDVSDNFVRACTAFLFFSLRK